MRKRKLRIKVWGILAVILIIGAAMIYLNRSSVIAPESVEELSSRSNRLLLTSSTNSLNIYNLTNKEITKFSDIIYDDKIIFAYADRLNEEILFLSETNGESTLRSIKNSGEKTLWTLKLKDLIARKVFRASDEQIWIIEGDLKRNLILIDLKGQIIKRYTSSDELVALSDDINNNTVEFAVFDGSKSTINLLNLDNLKAMPQDEVNGQISYFDDNKIVYSMKNTQNGGDLDDPTQKTTWNIAIKDRLNKKTEIITDGTLDQMAILSPDYKKLAYIQQSEDEQGIKKLIIINLDDRSRSELGGGIPLLFY